MWAFAGVLPLFILSTTLPLGCHGRRGTVGFLFEEGSLKTSGAKGVFLYADPIPGEGVVYQFEGMFLQTTPVRFQVWRPVDQSGQLYYLVGEKRYTPPAVPITAAVTLAPDEYIFTHNGDRFAIFNEAPGAALAYRFSADSRKMMLFSSVPDISVMKPRVEIQFNDFRSPEIYSASASYDTDTREYLIAARDARRPVTTATPRAIIPDFPANQGTLQYAGNSLSDRKRSLRGGARGIFILQERHLQSGRVTSFYANFAVRDKPVRFQIWRPTTNDRNTLMLVGEHRYVPVTTGKQMISLPVAKAIPTQDGDRLGFTNELDAGPIGYSFDTSTPGPLSLSLASGATYPEVGQYVTFDSVGVPYNFAVGLMYNVGGFNFRVLTPLSSSTTTPSTAVVMTTTAGIVAPSMTVPVLPAGQDTRRYIGNALSTGRSLVGGARGAFILQELFLQRGSVTGFFAYIMVQGHPVRFQIWRPNSKSSNVFTLVGEHRYVPETTGRRMVQLSQKDFISTVAGDRFGFTNEWNTSPISYNFNPSQPGSIPATLDGATFPEVGQDVTFSAVGLPYTFAVGLMHDIGLVATTTVSTNGPPAPPPIVPVPPRQKLLAEGINSPDKVLSVGARRTFLLKSQTFKEPGNVTSFWAYFVTGGEGQFQVWRPLPGPNQDTFRLVGKKDFAISLDPPATPRFMQVPVDDYIAVEVGDSLAFVNAAEACPIGYQFQPVSVYYAPPSDGAAVGTTLQFDIVSLPYNFGMAASYIPAVAPTTRSSVTTTRIPVTSSVTATTTLMTTSSTWAPAFRKSPNPPRSEPRPTKRDGTVSPKTGLERPLAGGEVPPEAASTAEENGVVRLMREPYFILALFIWLIIITILFLCVVCFLWCRKRARSSGHTYYDNRGLSAQPASSYIHWSSGLKVDETMDYFTPAVTTPSGRAPSGSKTTVQQARHSPFVSDEEDKTHL